MTDTGPTAARGRRPTAARVVSIRRFPLKSGAEQNPPRALLGPDGVVGDRAWAVVDAAGAALRPRDHPELARLSLAAVPDPLAALGAGFPELLLDGGGGWGARGGGAAEDLADLLGVPGAHLVALDPAAGAAPRAALHLVGADAAADPDAPPGADPGRRANLVLAGLAPGAERSWVGARLRVGAAGALLEVTALPRRCLGVYATVAVPGPVAVGDVVALEPPAGPAGGR